MKTRRSATRWSCYLHPENWPQSEGRAFLAEAVQLIGAARCIPWNGPEPSWMQHVPLREVPPVYEAFDEKGEPIAEVHLAFADIVRSIKSPATFAVETLSERQWIRSCVQNPRGGDPQPDLLLHALRGTDKSDQVSAAHWEAVSFQSAETREQLRGATASLKLIAQTLQKAILERDLTTFIRPIGGSLLGATPISKSYWELDDPLSRIAWCGLNIDAPFDPAAIPTHWLFVDRPSLVAHISTLEPSLVELSEHYADPNASLTEQKLYSEEVQDRVYSFLIEAFKIRPSAWKKEDFRNSFEAEQRCSISLSNWLAGWKRAATEHPDRSVAGRPRTRT